MFTPRSFQRKIRKKKNQFATNSSNQHLSSIFCDDTIHITSDAYGLNDQKMNLSKDRQVKTPQSLDFVPFNGFWGDDKENEVKKSNGSSGIWQFMPFEAKPTSPKMKSRPSVLTTRNRNVDQFALPLKPNQAKPFAYPFPSKAKHAKCFRVGDDETKTRAPLSSLTNIQNPKRGQVFKVQQPTKKSLKGAIKSILTPRTGHFSHNAIATTLSISTTESLSDDDDSIWNEVSPRYAAQRDLSIKYSQRSEISDGAKEQSLKIGDFARRVLRPNCTHVSASYWTAMNHRPYMEDRIVLDRIGSTTDSGTDVRQSHGLGMSKLLNKLKLVDTPVNGPDQTDLVSMSLHATSVYGVFDGHAGASASQYCADWFSCYLRNQQSFHCDLPQALKTTFESIDKDFMQSGKDDGTTACVCVVVGNKRVVCANAGDSRAIIVKNDGTFVQLSKDHKPGSPEENKRITDLGGRVIYHGGWRVEG